MDFKRFFNLFEDAARATERPAPTGQNSFVSIGSGHCRLERGLVFARVTAVTGTFRSGNGSQWAAIYG